MSGTFRPAAVFGDHMVLCQKRPIAVFGTAMDGTNITAQLNGYSACATARGGRFSLSFPPMVAGGPYELTLSDSAVTLRYTGVLIGEVYLAGGQSNMEMELKDSLHGDTLTAESNQPQIRYYNVPKIAIDDELLLLAEQQTCWRTLTPGNGGEMSAVAYHFATRLQTELNVPVGIIDCYWGGTSIACWMDETALRATAEGTALLTEFNASVAGKTQAECDEDVRNHDEKMDRWNKSVDDLRTAHPELTWPEVASRIEPCPWNPPASRKSFFRPAGLSETMVKRVAPYTLTGVLYYQGEEDTKQSGLYLALMQSLIAFWRKLFHNPLLPFLFVQLPMYRSSSEEEDYHWPQLRQAQEIAHLATRNTGLAVTIDLGELDNIHPTDKQPVGERLYQQALKVVYRKTDVPESPRAQYAYRDGTNLVIALSAPVHSNGEAILFEIAGEQGVFVPAKAVLTHTHLRLSAPGVSQPEVARYAWKNYAVVSVFGENGLPLAPFILS